MRQPDRSSPSVQGGVQNTILGSDFTGECSAAQSAAETLDTKRRRLGSAAPGGGALLPLPQPPSGAGVGISDVDMPVVGAGYSAAPADVPPWQVASYGAERPAASAPGVLATGREPVYADGIVGGDGYAADSGQPAVLGVRGLAESVFAAQDRASASAGSDFMVISPEAAPAAAPRRGVLGRLAAKLRRK